MIAFEIHDGAVRRCEDSGRVRRIVLPSPPLLSACNPRSKKERRRWARCGLKGQSRRGARRIAEPRPVPLFAALQCRTEVAHLLWIRMRGRVLLYLPEGEAVTQEHCDLVAACKEWT